MKKIIEEQNEEEEKTVEQLDEEAEIEAQELEDMYYGLLRW